MRFLLRTLSLSYAKNHMAKTILTILAVVVGVATFSAIKSAQETLTEGIKATVDRMAGKAHLQITMEGGVPEEVQENIRNLPGLRATAPIIEQLVMAEREELGSLLVLGVDLLGDREMRDYGFEGDDGDIDDPLLFLAQPDSVVLARQLAQKAGVKVGDSFGIRTPMGLRQVTVRGLLTPKGFAEAFGGNIVVTDVYAAQEIFGRGRHFDRLEVRLDKDVSVDQGEKTIGAALGPSFRVETPDRRGKNLESLTTNFTAGFNISSYVAMGIGSFLIFNAFQVSVNRRRRDIGTLRSIGATPNQILALFLTEGVIIGLIGGVLGMMLGAAASQSILTLMGKTTETIFGVAGPANAQIPTAVVVEAVLLGVIASVVGAWVPAREASRISAVEAFAKGSHQAKEAARPALRILCGFSLIALSIFIAIKAPFGAEGTTSTVIVVGAGGIVVMVDPLSRFILRWAAPLAAKIFPVAGQLACDAVRQNPRRTTGTVMATTLSLALVLGLGGHMGATKSSMVNWMNDILTSDLYVRASANWARPDYRYPAELKEELVKLPGVRRVESFRNAKVDYNGRQISLASVEMGQMMDRTRRDFVEGDEESMRRGVIDEGKCSVSDNFSAMTGLKLGDVVEFETPSGRVGFPIAAVTRDLSNDRGTVYIDRKNFVKYWKDDRVDVYDISLATGADREEVRKGIQTLLAGRYPALISTREEFTREITQAVDAFFSLIRIIVFLALVIACMGIASSLLISVAERNREIGILKALGALRGQISASVVMEGVTLAFVGLTLAIPSGNLMALFMEKVVALLYSGWTMPHVYPWSLLGFTLLALPLVTVVAAWLPARQASKIEITQAITYE